MTNKDECREAFEIQKFRINPIGESNIEVEGNEWFCHAHDVSKLKKAQQEKIDGLSGVVKSQKQTADALIKKLKAAEKREAELVEVLRQCDEAMDYISEYDIPLCLPQDIKKALENHKA